jgi:hypothetical protein
LTNNRNNIFVAGVLLLLATYIFLKRIALSGGALAFGDWLAMTTAIQQSCSLELSGAWTPPVQCLNTFLGNFVFPSPITYLLVTMGLKIAMLYALYKTASSLAATYYDRLESSILALLVVFFLVIAGGGRFLIGGTELILNSTIYSGMWAHLLVLTALAFFVRNKLAASGTIIAIAVFIHPANTFNVYVVLLIAVFIMHIWRTEPPELVKASVFALLGTAALILQYLAAFGMPSLELFSDYSPTSGGPITSDTSQGFERSEISTANWYTYIFSQDADDLSLIWLLSNKLGVFYLSFFVVGTFLATQVEGSYRLKVLLGRLPFVIIFASGLYLFCCIIVEYFQSPNFVFEKLIVVQPRRMFFLPVIFLSYYLIRYVLDFFWETKNITTRCLGIMLLVSSWFFVGLFLTSHEINLPRYVLGIFFFGVASTIAIFYWAKKEKRLTFLTALPKRWGCFLAAIIIAITLKTIPFVSADSLAATKTMFFDHGPRTFLGYLRVSAQLNGDDSFQDFDNLVRWMRAYTPKTAHFVSAGFSEDRIMQLPHLTDRWILSLNVYMHRGGMHYLKSNFIGRIVEFERLLGIPWQEMDAADGQLSRLQELVENMDEDYLRNMDYSDIEGFEYFLTTYSLDLKLPIAFQAGNIVAYQIRSLE